MDFLLVYSHFGLIGFTRRQWTMPAMPQKWCPVSQGGKRKARLESMLHPDGTAVPNGTASIYGLFWQLRGGQCNVHRDFGFQEGQRDPQLRQSIACDLLLEGGNVTKVHAAPVCTLPFSQHRSSQEASSLRHDRSQGEPNIRPLRVFDYSVAPGLAVLAHPSIAATTTS